MCGLISIVGNITVKEEKIFKQGLIVDVLRGEHSTGVAAVRRGHGNKEVFIAKQVGNPFELFYDRRYDLALSGINRALIGHNRYATQGKVNKQNAHPFNYGDVYGAHNGTLSDRFQLEDNKDFDVDSKALYNHISVHGLEDALGKVRGAWALTWWDASDETFNVIRNGERTLYRAKDEATGNLFFASEAEMLLLILNRNGVKFDEIVLIPENIWYSYPVDHLGAIGEPTMTEVKGKPAPVQQKAPATSGNSSGYRMGVIGNKRMFEIIGKVGDPKKGGYFVLESVDFENTSFRYYPLTTEVRKFEFNDIIVADVTRFVADKVPYYQIAPQTVKYATEDEIIVYEDKWSKARNEEISPKEEMILDHKGMLITRTEWEKRYHSCAWCSVSIDLDGDEDILLTREGDVLCGGCANDTDINKYVA